MSSENRLGGTAIRLRPADRAAGGVAKPAAVLSHWSGQQPAPRVDSIARCGPCFHCLCRTLKKPSWNPPSEHCGSLGLGRRPAGWMCRRMSPCAAVLPEHEQLGCRHPPDLRAQPHEDRAVHCKLTPPILKCALPQTGCLAPCGLCCTLPWATPRTACGRRAAARCRWRCTGCVPAVLAPAFHQPPQAGNHLCLVASRGPGISSASVADAPASHFCAQPRCNWRSTLPGRRCSSSSRTCAARPLRLRVGTAGPSNRGGGRPGWVQPPARVPCLGPPCAALLVCSVQLFCTATALGACKGSMCWLCEGAG